MNTKQFIVSALASAVALPLVSNMPAKAYSCAQLLAGMETAYNQFQAADERGDEYSMLKYYLVFEELVEQGKRQGCK